MGRLLGLPSEPWQELIISRWLARSADGNYAARRCGLAVPRQNGKGHVLELVELFKMVELGRRILHTAHLVPTSREHFMRMLSYFDNPRQYPFLARRVARIRETNGQEAIFLTNGGRIQFVARSKNSGRGFTADDLVLDEAQELGDDELEALLPAISAAPSGDPQQLWTGTPPGPNAKGEVWKRTRLAGVGGTDPSLAWLEWSAPDDADPDDREVWAATNPALGRRIRVESVESERGSMSDEGFLRERLGQWTTNGSGLRVIPQEAWSAIADPGSSFTGDFAFGIEVDEAHEHAAIAAAGRRADGKVHLEYIEGSAEHLAEPGLDWLIPVCLSLNAQKPRAFVIDQSSPAGYLINPLRDAGLKVVTASQQTHAQACGRLFEVVKSDQAVHIDQPPLNFALSVARKRTLSEGAWVWHRKAAESDITPIVAVTLALFGLDVPMKVEKPRTNRAVFS